MNNMKLNTEQISFDDLLVELEAEYEKEYTTISGKPQTPVSNYEKLTIYDYDIGETITGTPEITYFENKDRKSDSLRLRIINDDEYTDLYIYIPKPDENGLVHNIRKGFNLYRTCFDFIYSILRYQDEHNVIDENGEEKNHFETVNILLFAKYLDQFNNITVKVTEGNIDSKYDSWIIIKIQ